MSSASAALPTMRYAIPNKRGRTLSNTETPSSIPIIYSAGILLTISGHGKSGSRVIRLNQTASVRGHSFVDLLTKNDVYHDLKLIDRSFSETQDVRSRLLHRGGEAERALLTALKQDPIPSVQDVAQRL